MKKKELFERIDEGSPVVIGIPVGNKIRYVSVDREDLKKTLKGVSGNLNLPCTTVGDELPREQTARWTIFFDVVGIKR